MTRTTVGGACFDVTELDGARLLGDDDESALLARVRDRMLLPVRGLPFFGR